MSADKSMSHRHWYKSYSAHNDLSQNDLKTCGKNLYFQIKAHNVKVSVTTVNASPCFPGQATGNFTFHIISDIMRKIFILKHIQLNVNNSIVTPQNLYEQFSQQLGQVGHRVKM